MALLLQAYSGVSDAESVELTVVDARWATGPRLSGRRGAFHVDRGYINRDLVDDVQSASGAVICKPWFARGQRPELFKKTDFKLDMRSRTITCPAGQVEHFEPGNVVEFD